MNDLTEVIDGPGDTSVYRWCLTSYPPKYRSEHGDDILATIKDARGGQSRASLRECAALIVGGVRRRAAEAAADGPVKALFSALRGTAMILLLYNAAVEITGILHHWTAPKVEIPSLWVAIYSLCLRSPFLESGFVGGPGSPCWRAARVSRAQPTG